MCPVFGVHYKVHITPVILILEENAIFTVNNLFLLLTGLLAAYLCWHFWRKYNQQKKIYDLSYLMGLAVLWVQGFC